MHWWTFGLFCLSFWPPFWGSWYPQKTKDSWQGRIAGDDDDLAILGSAQWKFTRIPVSLWRYCHASLSPLLPPVHHTSQHMCVVNTDMKMFFHDVVAHFNVHSLVAWLKFNSNLKAYFNFVWNIGRLIEMRDSWKRNCRHITLGKGIEVSRVARGGVRKPLCRRAPGCRHELSNTSKGKFWHLWIPLLQSNRLLLDISVCCQAGQRKESWCGLRVGKNQSAPITPIQPLPGDLAILVQITQRQLDAEIKSNWGGWGLVPWIPISPKNKKYSHTLGSDTRAREVNGPNL